MLCRAAQSVAVPGATPTVSLREASQPARVRSSQKSLARCSAQGAAAAESEAPALSKLAPGSASSWPALGSACKEISLCFRRRALSCCWRKARAASWRSPSGVRSKMHATANISWGPSSRLACRRHFCANARRWRWFSRLNAAIAARCCFSASTDMALERGAGRLEKKRRRGVGKGVGLRCTGWRADHRWHKGYECLLCGHHTRVRWHNPMGRTQMVRAGPYMKQAGGLTARCVMVGSSFFTVAERGARTRHRPYGCRRLPPCAHVIKRAAPVKTHGAGAAEQLADPFGGTPCPLRFPMGRQILVRRLSPAAPGSPR